ITAYFNRWIGTCREVQSAPAINKHPVRAAVPGRPIFGIPRVWHHGPSAESYFPVCETSTSTSAVAGSPTKLTGSALETPTTVPTNTYQVQASGVNSLTAIIAASEVAIPVITPVWLARRVNTPNRNAPSIGP